jgi:ubiquitin carboxyl-terminal hydrolase 7
MNTTPLRFTKHSNAYMLVYIRESDKEKIICDLDEEDISEHLKVIFVYSNSFSIKSIEFV